MKFIKFVLGIFLLIVLIACWPIALIITIFWGLMKVGMKQDFEP